MQNIVHLPVAWLICLMLVVVGAKEHGSSLIFCRHFYNNICYRLKQTGLRDV